MKKEASEEDYYEKINISLSETRYADYLLSLLDNEKNYYVARSILYKMFSNDKEESKSFYWIGYQELVSLKEERIVQSLDKQDYFMFCGHDE